MSHFRDNLYTYGYIGLCVAFTIGLFLGGVG